MKIIKNNCLTSSKKIRKKENKENKILKNINKYYKKTLINYNILK
jgi:hypothetical protein